MTWWLVALVFLFVLLLAPPWTYIVAKFAGAGWVAGINSYIRNRRRGS